MSYSTTILCLANSRKFSGHRIAGKELRNGVIGPWIRPVSGRKTGELSDVECAYTNGKTPELLDVSYGPMGQIVQTERTTGFRNLLRRSLTDPSI